MKYICTNCNDSFSIDTSIEFEYFKCPSCVKIKEKKSIIKEQTKKQSKYSFFNNIRKEIRYE